MILIVSPHFDDAVFSCGEFIARHVGEGEEVLVLTVIGDWPEGDIEYPTRWWEEMAVAGRLGYTATRMLGFVDGKFGQPRSGADLTEKLGGMVEEINPSMILVPMGIAHRDHAFVAGPAYTVAHGWGAGIAVYEELPYRVLHPRTAVHSYDRLHAPESIANGGFYAEKLAACKLYTSQYGGDVERCCMAPERIWRVR